MSNVETSTIWQEVEQVLKNKGPLKIAELFDEVDCAEDRKQLTNLIYLRKKKGLLKRLDGGLYALANTKKGGASRGKAKTNNGTDRTPAHETEKPKPAADPVDEFLHGAVQATQAALDEYLVSLADPELLVQLKRAREHAKSALERYRGGKPH